jgi:internalin A
VGQQREAAVDRLCAAADEGRPDRPRQARYALPDRISHFMDRIGRGERVFIILNDKYLRSQLHS